MHLLMHCSQLLVCVFFTKIENRMPSLCLPPAPPRNRPSLPVSLSCVPPCPPLLVYDIPGLASRTAHDLFMRDMSRESRLLHIRNSVSTFMIHISFISGTLEYSSIQVNRKNRLITYLYMTHVNTVHVSKRNGMIDYIFYRMTHIMFHITHVTNSNSCVQFAPLAPGPCDRCRACACRACTAPRQDVGPVLSPCQCAYSARRHDAPRLASSISHAARGHAGCEAYLDRAPRTRDAWPWSAVRVHDRPVCVYAPRGIQPAPSTHIRAH